MGYSVVSMELISNEECDNFNNQVILKLTRHCEKVCCRGLKIRFCWSREFLSCTAAAVAAKALRKVYKSSSTNHFCHFVSCPSLGITEYPSIRASSLLPAGSLVVVELLPDLLHLAPAAVHQLDDAVRRARQQQRDRAQDDAPVDVRSLAPLQTRRKVWNF